MRLHARSILFLCFLAAAAVGRAQERQPYIINGLPTDAFPAVGIVGEASVGGFCTGTLISPTHVLTAAHCGEAILAFGSPDTGTFEVAGRVYRTASVEIYPTYDDQLYRDDIAILVLADPVMDVDPMPISTVPPEVGETVTLVGFGAQGTPEAGSDGSFGVKLMGTVIVDNVTDFEFSWVFDDPLESNSAPGDSGGPVLIDTADGYLLVGTVSSGTTEKAELGDNSFNMRVDAYAAWITETVLLTTIPEDVPTEDPAVEDLPDPWETVDEPAETVDEPVGTVDEPVETVDEPVDTAEGPAEDVDSETTDTTTTDDGAPAATCPAKPAGAHGGNRDHHRHHHHGCGCQACSPPPPCTTAGSQNQDVTAPAEQAVEVDAPDVDAPGTPSTEQETPAGDVEVASEPVAPGSIPNRRSRPRRDIQRPLSSHHDKLHLVHSAPKTKTKSIANRNARTESRFNVRRR